MQGTGNGEFCNLWFQICAVKKFSVLDACTGTICMYSILMAGCFFFKENGIL